MKIEVLLNELFQFDFIVRCNVKLFALNKVIAKKLKLQFFMDSFKLKNVINY